MGQIHCIILRTQKSCNIKFSIESTKSSPSVLSHFLYLYHLSLKIAVHTLSIAYSYFGYEYGNSKPSDSFRYLTSQDNKRSTKGRVCKDIAMICLPRLTFYAGNALGDQNENNGIYSAALIIMSIARVICVFLIQFVTWTLTCFHGVTNGVSF